MTVLAVSTDSWNLVDRFFERTRKPRILMGWAGPSAMSRTRTRGVPSTFVLDEDHRVVYHTGSGIQPGDELFETVELLVTASATDE